jgi:hypothetical protein
MLSNFICVYIVCYVMCAHSCVCTKNTNAKPLLQNDWMQMTTIEVSADERHDRIMHAKRANLFHMYEREEGLVQEKLGHPYHYLSIDDE